MADRAESERSARRISGHTLKEMAMDIVTWIVGIPVVVLTVAYAVILAEMLAAKRRMRLH